MRYKTLSFNILFKNSLHFKPGHQRYNSYFLYIKVNINMYYAYYLYTK